MPAFTYTPHPTPPCAPQGEKESKTQNEGYFGGSKNPLPISSSASAL